MTTPPARQINSWQKAEQNAAAWMAYLGFRNVRLTAGGADGGIDIVSDGAVAQVKYEASNVGRPQLQRLVGARGKAMSTLLFFTGADYSSAAVLYADSMDIALFRYELDGKVLASNATAQNLLTRAHQAERSRASPASGSATRSRPAVPHGGQLGFVENFKREYRAQQARRVEKTPRPLQSEQAWRTSLRQSRHAQKAPRSTPASAAHNATNGGCLTAIATLLIVVFVLGFSFNADNRSGAGLAGGLTFLLLPAAVCVAIVVWLRRRRRQ